MRFFLLVALLGTVSYGYAASPFLAKRVMQDGVEVAVLSDDKAQTEVRVVPSLGNRAISFTIHGQNILYVPFTSLTDKGAQHGLSGVPFLAPWANRLDEAGYWFGPTHYALDATTGNFGKDGNGLPIHGLLANSTLWKISDLASNGTAARVTSRLEFWKSPELLHQWPWVQEYEMTYTLSKDGLQVETRITNRSAESMPVAIGFHPYYRIPGQPRDNWTLQIPAHKAVVANAQLIPTGEYRDVQFPGPVSLKDRHLDDGFTDLQRGPDGRAHFVIASGSRSIHIAFGPKYPVAILWNPPIKGGPDHEFVCVEPMTGVTDAINLNHAGKYPDLQVVKSGQSWTESFFVEPQGFE